MPSSDFFAGFPIITYNGQTCLDITKSVNMVANVVSNGAVLTPYVVDQNIRSDQLAQRIYGDPGLEWLFFLSNGMTDPFDWYMGQNEFYTYLDNKYGDYITTQQTIAYYTNNWYVNQQIIPASTYDALPVNLIKYYEPVYRSGALVGYSRRQIDWTIATNHIVQYEFSNTTFTPFTNNEVVTVTYDSVGGSSKGQVCFSSPSTGQLSIQHVSGAYNYANAVNVGSFSIIGSQSNAKITIANNNQMTVNYYDTFPVSNDTIEYTYYDPVTVFDVENFKNESKKDIYYLGNNYVTQALTELKNSF